MEVLIASIRFFAASGGPRSEEKFSERTHGPSDMIGRECGRLKGGKRAFFFRHMPGSVFDREKSASVRGRKKNVLFVHPAPSLLWTGPDEDLFLEYFNNHPEMKLIIAPHVIDENHLVEIISKLKRPYVRYTRADEKNVLKADCLIIDCFGLLSSIYRYGEIAYIGGGFGVGIHNTLEAAVYGIPVIFGPKYQKFMEAVQLLEAKGAYSIKDYDELKTLLDRFRTDEVFLRETGTNAGYYVTSNAGATEKIMHMINF